MPYLQILPQSTTAMRKMPEVAEKLNDLSRRQTACRGSRQHFQTWLHWAFALGRTCCFSRTPSLPSSWYSLTGLLIATSPLTPTRPLLNPPLLLTNFNDMAIPMKPRSIYLPAEIFIKAPFGFNLLPSEDSQIRTIGSLCRSLIGLFTYLAPTVLYHFFHSYFLSQLTTYHVPSTSKSPN